MFDQSAYNLTQQLQGALFQRAFADYNANLTDEMRANQPTPNPLFQLRTGYAESPGWMLVQVAEFVPEPLTVELFRKRAVYSAPGLSHALLELLASEGWLDRRGDAYHLIEAGQEMLTRIAQRRRAILKSLALSVNDELQRLAEAMDTVIDFSLNADDPPGVWCLSHSRNRAPHVNATAQERIVQYCADFNAFRDDAHMAAYSQYEVDGHTWEAFAFIADGQADDAMTLFEQLAYRGFAREDWQRALDRLEAQRWMQVATDGKCIATAAGKDVQKNIEALTNKYFYEPWRQFGEENARQMIDLIKQIIETCTEPQQAGTA